MRMEIALASQGGKTEALMGMGLSHGLINHEDFVRFPAHGVDMDVMNKLYTRAELLAAKDGGHNKFLESIIVWVSIRAPRYWWQEMDTYRHLSKQSESTMHTITKRLLIQEDFVADIFEGTLTALNVAILTYRQMPETHPDKQELFEVIKRNLPEGLLQTRLVRLDMMTLRNIYRQRRNHRLPEWRVFLNYMEENLGVPIWRWVTSSPRDHQIEALKKQIWELEHQLDVAMEQRYNNRIGTP